MTQVENVWTDFRDAMPADINQKCFLIRHSRPLKLGWVTRRFHYLPKNSQKRYEKALNQNRRTYTD